MKLFLLSAFGMMVAVSVAQPKSPGSGLEAQLKKLHDLLEQRLASLNDLLSDTASSEEWVVPATHAAKSREPEIGLQTGTLCSSSVQPARGLQSRARGLSSEAEWRQMFPHKPGYSR